MNSLLEHILKEITFNDLRVKQRSIGKLFPSFGARVQAVAAKGGVEMKEQMPEWWHFEVASGTKAGVKYDVYVQFLNLEEMIKRYAGDRRLWNKEGTDVDYRLLAAEVLNHVDMRTSCSCPATLYWGQDYIRTARDAQFGKQEYRPPDIRNPKQYGAYCKHGQNVMNVLPAYTSTFASYLKKFWVEEVTDTVDLAKAQYGAVKKAAAELGRRAEERPVGYTRGGKEIPLPPEEEIPPEEELPPEGGVPVEPIGPQPATSPATRKPGPEPKPEDKEKKGKYRPNESINEKDIFQPASAEDIKVRQESLEHYVVTEYDRQVISGPFKTIAETEDEVERLYKLGYHEGDIDIESYPKSNESIIEKDIFKRASKKDIKNRHKRYDSIEEVEIGLDTDAKGYYYADTGEPVRDGEYAFKIDEDDDPIYFTDRQAAVEYLDEMRESVVEGISKRRLGKCYVLSGRFVMDNPEYELVHGTITRRPDNYTIQHAWVETIEQVGNYKIRTVYDPVMDEKLPWDAYERIMGAKEDKRYTQDQLMHILAKQKNWGPWE